MSRKTWTLLAVLAVIGAMIAITAHAKTLYDTFCKVTGYGGTTSVAKAAPSGPIDRDITVRFDANVNGLPIKFGPKQARISVRPGENALAFYTVTNTSDRPVVAHATYNVTPHKMGPYFSKLECFCFTDRVFNPGETVTLPVVFFINPLMDEERNLDDVMDVTLSYTFFPAEGRETADASAAVANDGGS